MAFNTINIELAQVALDRADGLAFENFFQAFYPDIAGEEFIPLGGIGDGGADAFQEGTLFEGKSTGYFYQASREADYSGKIRRTIRRLRGFGREPTALIYVTSRKVQHIDVEEARIGRDLGAVIRIRDANYIAVNINHGPATRAAFDTYLRPCVDFLRQIGGTRILTSSKHVSSPAVFVFLRQELDRHQGEMSLTNALADGLILWALEGTDPDQNKFLAESAIIEKIESTVPPAGKILRGIIPRRLKALAKIPKGLGRPIRWHRKQNSFCLSYEIRRRIEENNLQDEALRVATLDIFESRVAEYCGDSLTPEQRRLAAELSLSAVQRTFESEGLEFAAFLERKLATTPPRTLVDHVHECLLESGVNPEEYELLRQGISENLRGAFSESMEEERILFSKLGATYTLLFCMKTEPRLVEYFQTMASDFYLYVGSDILVRALSERYLRLEDQLARNALRVISDTGGQLVLCEPVLEEVCSHLEATDYEFVNWYDGLDDSAGYAASYDAPILIRSYFEARVKPPVGIEKPKDWCSFVNQCCDYHLLHRLEGREQLKSFLLSQFQMEYETSEEIAGLCDPTEVEKLTKQFAEEKDDERLARSDALLALAVYGRRFRRGEGSRISEFGYRTWWLTRESRVLKHSGWLVRKHGAYYMMRPEFVLNFIALAPSTAEVRRAYGNIFPSSLGLQLARQVDRGQLDRVLEQVREAEHLEPGRRAALIRYHADKLKGDFGKEYPHEFD